MIRKLAVWGGIFGVCFWILFCVLSCRPKFTPNEVKKFLNKGACSVEDLNTHLRNLQENSGVPDSQIVLIDVEKIKLNQLRIHKPHPVYMKMGPENGGHWYYDNSVVKYGWQMDVFRPAFFNSTPEIFIFYFDADMRFIGWITALECQIE